MRLERDDGFVVVDERFESLSDALKFFTNTVFEVGRDLASGEGATARFGLTASPDTQFGIGLAFAQIVPEPGTATLLLLGLVVMSLQRSPNGSA